MSGNHEQTAPRDEMGRETESGSDFWWNLVYFVILAVAIGFVIANNDMDSLFSATGIIVLAVLGVLAAYPSIYLVRLARKHVRQKKGRE